MDTMADSSYTCTLCPKTFGQKRNLTRHMLTHEEAKYSCQHCNKLFHRTDLLSKHQTKCLPKNETNCDMCGKTLSKKSHLTRHKKVCKLKQQEKKMKKEADDYRQKLNRGEMVENILRKCPETLEEALNASDKEALKLYQSSCEGDIGIATVVLKPWQSDVIKLIDSPSDRHIYWIIGYRGNEGKTFLQQYILQYFGIRRVVKTEINARKCDLAYLLSMDTLTCKDIFVFNLLRSDAEVSYGLMENIKDGYLVSTKYRTKSLKITTPNTVIVFSNSFPSTSLLSADRWKIFEISENELYAKEVSAESQRTINPHLSDKHTTVYYD